MYLFIYHSEKRVPDKKSRQELLIEFKKRVSGVKDKEIYIYCGKDIESSKKLLIFTEEAEDWELLVIRNEKALILGEEQKEKVKMEIISKNDFSMTEFLFNSEYFLDQYSKFCD